jgi:hypothetical protein
MIIVRIIGGLGNQMFQYAFFKNLKAKYPDVKCDIQGYKKYKLHSGFSLQTTFNIEIDQASPAEIDSVTNIHRSNIFSKIKRKIFGNLPNHIIENDFNWEMPDSTGDLYLDGYWQSEKYFGDHATLKSDFKFNHRSDSKNQETEDRITSCHSVSMHIRRGDYIGNKVHVKLDEEYYNNSIILIKNHVEDAVFFIFSDDVFWVRQSLLPRLKLTTDFIIVEKDTLFPDNDMRLMALCRHNIIANSSFSWWGAWLNGNDKKLVIAPKQWYTNPTMNSRQMDQIPRVWMKV